MKRELLVGVVFFVLITILLGVTLWVDDPGFLGDGPAHRMTTRFKTVAGLSRGDDVWIYGTLGGRVETVRPDGTGFVEVDLALDYDPQLRENCEIALRPRSALAGMVVAIYPGTPDHPLLNKQVYDGKNQSDVLGEMGKLLSDIREPLMESIENIRTVSASLSERSDAIAENLENFTASADRMTKDLEAGKGTLGKLLRDDSLYEEFRGAVDQIKKVGDTATDGKGTIAMLLNDEAFADDLKASVSSLRTTAERLESADGTLGKLMNDSALYDEMTGAAQDIRALVHDARNGDGALPKLLNDKGLADRIDRISANVEDITGKLSRGEGTLGKLLADDKLYNDLESAIADLTEGTGQARENAPIITFAGFLFGAF